MGPGAIGLVGDRVISFGTFGNGVHRLLLVKRKLGDKYNSIPRDVQNTHVDAIIYTD